MIAISWKYPHVYIEVSGTMPKYIMTPNTGWEPLLVYGNGLLQDRVLWGSNWPMIEPKESLGWVRKFPLKEEVKEKWLALRDAGVDLLSFPVVLRFAGPGIESAREIVRTMPGLELYEDETSLEDAVRRIVERTSARGRP